MDLHVFTQCPINVRLIALRGCGVVPEPRDHVGVEAKRELLFQGPIEEATFGARPVAEFGRIRRIDLAVRQDR